MVDATRTEIRKQTVVSIHYTLTDADGKVLDSSVGDNGDSSDEPLTYLHGSGEIVPGLERQLEGHFAGDRVNAVVPPKDGYGDKNGRGPQIVPRSAFVGIDEIEPGMCFDTEDDKGESQTVWVVKIEKDKIFLDYDHPLAGVTLHFDVQVVDVRKATAEEMSHGHAHGADGHHHH